MKRLPSGQIPYDVSVLVKRNDDGTVEYREYQDFCKEQGLDDPVIPDGWEWCCDTEIVGIDKIDDRYNVGSYAFDRDCVCTVSDTYAQFDTLEEANAELEEYRAEVLQRGGSLEQSVFDTLSATRKEKSV